MPPEFSDDVLILIVSFVAGSAVESRSSQPDHAEDVSDVLIVKFLVINKLSKLASHETNNPPAASPAPASEAPEKDLKDN